MMESNETFSDSETQAENDQFGVNVNEVREEGAIKSTPEPQTAVIDGEDKKEALSALPGKFIGRVRGSMANPFIAFIAGAGLMYVILRKKAKK